MSSVPATSDRPRRRRADPSFWILAGVAVLILAFLYLPVVVLIVFSFNDNVVTTLPLK
jgi:ABC-type spermidine/putrescine transport system permease subunit II